MPETPLYTILIEHKNKDYSSFHTPGHKCSEFFPQELLKLDLTELPDTDALYEADGAIRSAEIKLAELFGAKHTLISSGGCTLAIQTMLRLACEKGKKIMLLSLRLLRLSGTKLNKYGAVAEMVYARVLKSRDSLIM